MVTMLRVFAVLSLIGGIIGGSIIGNNVFLYDGFSIMAALPLWVGGLVSSVVFAALAQILDHLIVLRTKLVGDVKKRYLTADGFVTVED